MHYDKLDLSAHTDRMEQTTRLPHFSASQTGLLIGGGAFIWEFSIL